MPTDRSDAAKSWEHSTGCAIFDEQSTEPCNCKSDAASTSGRASLCAAPHWLDRVDWNDPLSYLRERYGVPAVVGRRVTIWTGERGVIVGADDGHLLVRVADAVHDNPVVRLHPTWKIEYGAEVVANV